ncbi:MAG: hypothetical protein JWP15_2137 [Alphaproteobacteria bacterium]|nr:hypothetical protein [Alphaproteobacteria bacterium]
MDRVLNKPTWRKPAGMLMLLLLIAAWAAVVATLFDWLPSMPWPIQALFFIATGIVWILPLKPLLLWMETGRWRLPKA